MKATFVLGLSLIVSLINIHVTTAQWCSERSPTNCCKGRDDSCTVPYKGIMCYCDIFCNHTITDCCPDFFPTCHGIENPLKTQGVCYHNNKEYPVGTSINDNCNKCICQKNGVDSFAFSCENIVCLIQRDLLDDVNDADFGWEASNYTSFWGMTLKEGVKYRLGTLQADGVVARMTDIDMDYDESLIPESFDAREKWPGLVHGIMDQGDCGCSWAFSTTGVASDRLSIQSKGSMTMMLSPQHLLSCNTRRQRGCQGGYLDRAWWYMRKRGVVSHDCYPYDNGHQDKKGSCAMPSKNVGSCPGGRWVDNDLYRCTPPYRISAKEKDIQHEIMENGPVQATFQVKEDFFMYKRGVYQYTRLADSHKRAVGHHSVKIIGWGSEYSYFGKELKYWLCANSWGTSWGENGYFKIARGENECGIESFVLGVWGKVDEMSRIGGLNKLTRRPSRKRKRKFKRSTLGIFDWLFDYDM
ncbi:putative peptidase C1-like protein F26E4.3 [Glandiceps talaboti]